MEFLRFLESLRTPFGDALMLAITELGGEVTFLAVAILFLWCFDKKTGYYLLAVGVLGTTLNQILKLGFRVPRPWVREPSFTIVEGARAGAAGYSFPSGHTQNAVGIFGGIARAYRARWLRVLTVAAAVLIPFSRMYLGVHTSADVIASVAVALCLLFFLFPLFQKYGDSNRFLLAAFSVMLIFAAGFLLFVLSSPTAPDAGGAENYASGMKNAYVLLGTVSGCGLAILFDRAFLHYETHCPPLFQLCKLVPGFALLLLLKWALKAPLLALFDGNPAADALRYFLIALFAGAVWPMTFRLLPAKAGKREKKEP